jgi:hypothetical protein
MRFGMDSTLWSRFELLVQHVVPVVQRETGALAVEV